MRVLWIVNVVLPDVAGHFGCERVPFGGWVPAMLRQLVKISGIEIGVAMRAPVAKLASTVVDGITYYAMPQRRSDRFDVAQADCEAVLGEFKPDLLHAEGSEMAYTQRFLSTWKGRHLLSLQGVINGYEPYEYGGLRVADMLASLNPLDGLAALAMVANKRFVFLPRLRLERKTIGLARNVMGRTLWDRSHAHAINPLAAYYPCSRILRDVFYAKRWQQGDFEPHTIFIGNAGSPRKGAHFVLQAVELLRREFPNIKLLVAGEAPGSRNRGLTPAGLKGMIGYGAYLGRLVRRMGLEDHVEFLGVLQAEQMAERMRRSHVYVMSSIIENSPNTLGEAMMMGVPSVAAYTGGVPSMATDEVDALFYRADDPACLAYQVKRLLDDRALCDALSEKAMAHARNTHDPQRNLQLLLAAYAAILGGDAFAAVAAGAT